ncbi:C40 family peptidase [Ottowia thiooxydans]|uniref:C40 family peptidase n=1 Tax=Ottowia thiooxydans TaxID=219182 RepID=UPI000403FA1C|nr:C40 family peptidase [Ottowia thiooxydans]
MSKSKLFAAIIALAAMNAAYAAPAQDEIDKLLLQKGLMARLGDSIQQATDRAADLVVNAMGAIGVPYRKGGNTVETGFDCSGFVRAIYQQTVGMVLPRRAEEQAAATEHIEKAELKPGDLVFFNTMRRAYSHVGIYVGDGKFIHSPRTGSHVRVENMQIGYWQKRFNGARRVLDHAEQEQPSSSRVTTRESPSPRSVRLGGSFSQPSVSVQPDAKLGIGEGI